MKIGDQRLKRTLKYQTVRRVLKDNKVPGTSAGTRAAEAPARAQGLLQDSWESARLGCVSSQVLIWTRGLEYEEFLKKEKKIEARSS